MPPGEPALHHSDNSGSGGGGTAGRASGGCGIIEEEGRPLNMMMGRMGGGNGGLKEEDMWGSWATDDGQQGSWGRHTRLMARDTGYVIEKHNRGWLMNDAGVLEVGMEAEYTFTNAAGCCAAEACCSNSATLLSWTFASSTRILDVSNGMLPGLV